MKTSTRFRSFWSLGVLLMGALFFVQTANAQESGVNDAKKKEEEALLQEACKTNLRACEIKSRMSTFEPNYAIWQFTDGDQQALEAHYSFRYLFTRPHCVPGHDLIAEFPLDESKECIANYDRRLEFFFAYTGEFDFYANTRPSGPVVNRISNPGFYWRKHIPDSKINWLTLSLEHRSNGQVIEIDETDSGVLKTQTAFANDDHEYIDGISRGANFVELEAKFRATKTDKFYVSVKHYINHDSTVNWGPTAADDPKISDYDRVRLVWARSKLVKGRKAEFAVAWLIGDKGFETDSFDVDFMYPVTLLNADIPFFIKYHNGPMNTLSDYTREQNTIGFGIKLQQ